MRLTAKIDSATADEARDFIYAYQRSRPPEMRVFDSPPVEVRMAGVGWGVETPPMDPQRFGRMMNDTELRIRMQETADATG